jgi:Ni/Co efflux regulator RcnB
MSKLLTAVLAAVFATVTVAPVAFAQDKKDEKAVTKSSEAGKAKADDGKAKADATKADKGDAKKAEKK